MRQFHAIVMSTLCILFGPAVLSVHAQFAELARQVPSSANAIAFVNIEKLMESPVAKRDGWADKRDKAYGAGLTMLPPEGQHAILASQMDLDVWVPIWEAAVMQIDHEPSMARIAGMTGGQVDNIGGKEAVTLPADATIVRTGPNIVAMMAPANRQSVARWMKEVTARREHALSPYLGEAFRFANDFGTPVILALDIEDALTHESIKENLSQPDAKAFLSKNKLDESKVSAMLASLRGITLGITFAEKPFGKIKVDFREDVVLTPEAAKAALLHALAERGAMIDELVDWAPGVKGKQVTLEGFLTASGMRRLSSLFDRPPSLRPKEMPAPTASTPQQGSKYTAQASQHYFHEIQNLLEDLSKEKKKNSSYTMAQIGVWMDKYAKKIDQLSVLAVDPELVEFGANTANALRAGYSAIRTGAARSRVRQVNTEMQYNTYSYGSTYGFTYRDSLLGAGYVPYGYSGYVQVPNTLAYQHERTRVKAEERVNSAQSARDIMGQIEAETGRIRRAMTQKYQVDF